MDLINALLISGLSGFVSAVATVTAIRTDISWLKLIVNDHSKRILKLEEQKQ